MKRTYRYRIYPTSRQAVALEEQLGFACDLWNAALEQRRDWWKRGRRVTRYDQQRQLTVLRQDGHLAPAGMACSAQRDPLIRLERAFQAFFRRCAAGETPGYPRFKSKRRYDSLSWPFGNGAQVRDGRLRLKGIGHVKVRWHRDIPEPAEVTQATVHRGARGWHVCFALDMPTPEPLRPNGRSIGVDVGIVRMASLSNGVHLKGPRAAFHGAAKTRRLQRSVGRKQRGSTRRAKAIQGLARQRDGERCQRKDRAHKIARGLVERFELIALEDLRITNMVRGNRGLAREIHDQGWGLLVSCLSYKAADAGRSVVLVDPRYTSQTCAECGHVDSRSRDGVSFCCTSCGHEDHADTNAARNILARAERSGANGEPCPLPEKSIGGHATRRVAGLEVPAGGRIA